MTKAIELKDKDTKPALWLEIAYDIARDDEGDYTSEPTLTWIAQKYGLTTKESLSIITNPNFSKFIHEMQVAIARFEFDKKAFNILDEIMVESDEEKNRIAAIKTAAELLGYKASGGININFNLDSAIRKADMGEGASIDVEAFPGL